MERDEQHVRITYRIGISYDYRIKSRVAASFMRAITEWLPGTLVTIDDHVTEELPYIPCAALWEA